MFCTGNGRLYQRTSECYKLSKTIWFPLYFKVIIVSYVLCRTLVWHDCLEHLIKFANQNCKHKLLITFPSEDTSKVWKKFKKLIYIPQGHSLRKFVGNPVSKPSRSFALSTYLVQKPLFPGHVKAKIIPQVQPHSARTQPYTLGIMEKEQWNFLCWNYALSFLGITKFYHME